MIFYDVGDWQLTTIWRYRGSVLPQATAWAFTSAMLEAVLRHSGLVDTYLYQYIDVTRDAGSLSFVWWGFTAILGMLVGVRCNTSYQRFWEGAKLVYLVRGEWFNCVSSLLSFCSEDPMKHDHVHLFQHTLVRIASLLHCMALQHVCDVAEDSLEILDMEGFDDESLEYLDTVHDRCDVLVQWLQRLIMQNSRKGVLDAAPPILTRSFQELSRGIVNLNNVRRIKDIPFPYPYHQITVLVLMLHWFLTPFLACMYVNSAVLATILIFVGQTGLWAIIFISNEMDQPFGEDPNDLPMADMQRDFNRSLLSLLHPLTQQVPKYQTPKAEDDAGEGLDEAILTRRQNSAKGRHQTLKFEQIATPTSPTSPLSVAVVLKPDVSEESNPSGQDDVEPELNGGNEEGGLKSATRELCSEDGEIAALRNSLDLKDFTLSPSSSRDDFDLFQIPQSKSTPKLAPAPPAPPRDATGRFGGMTRAAPSDEDDALAELPSLEPQKQRDNRGWNRQYSGQSQRDNGGWSRQYSGQSQVSSGSSAGEIKFTTNPLRHKARNIRSTEVKDTSLPATSGVKKSLSLAARPRRFSQHKSGAT